MRNISEIEDEIVPLLSERTDILERKFHVSPEEIYRLRRKWKVKQDNAAGLLDCTFCLHISRHGLTLEEMVVKYTIPSSTIRYYFKKHGLPFPKSRGRGDKQSVEAARRDLQNGAFEWEVYERNAISVNQFCYLREGEGGKRRLRPKQSTKGERST